VNRIGVSEIRFAHFSHVWNKPGMTPEARYDQLWRELAVADASGFDYAFCVEHHFNPNESWMPSPSIYCAAAAARTDRIRIGTLGYVLPLYDPLRIAEEVAVLDNLAHGRLELGLVSGIVPDFFGPYRADFANRRAVTHEGLALIKHALSCDGAFSFTGEFRQYKTSHWALSRCKDLTRRFGFTHVMPTRLLCLPAKESIQVTFS
jgi:alkanesulfonate monooxygenase SsuD/methylene tetrahydromethanopterin reductase-like flavin-dependent oxidoreductase (luciferase family)